MNSVEYFSRQHVSMRKISREDCLVIKRYGRKELELAPLSERIYEQRMLQTNLDRLGRKIDDGLQ